MKPDVDTLLTVPDAPPAAGPERAFDPPPADAVPAVETFPGTDCPVVDVAGVTVAEEDATRPTESPVTKQMSAAATIQILLRSDSCRRTLGQRVCSAMDVDVDESGEGGNGEVLALAGPSATGCSDVALDTGRPGGSSSKLVDS